MKDELSRFARGGWGVRLQGSLRPDTAPLRFWWAGLRGIRAPLAEETLRRISFRAVREGVGVFASKARSGLTPLRYGFGGRGSAVSGLRSLSRLWGG